MDELREQNLKEALWQYVRGLADAKGQDRVNAWNMALKKMKTIVAEIREDREGENADRS